jgi:hypothetical protein
LLVCTNVCSLVFNRDLYGLAADGAGGFFLVDNTNSMVWRYNGTTLTAVIAGSFTGNAGYSGDGGPAINAQREHAFSGRVLAFVTPRLPCHSISTRRALTAVNFPAGVAAKNSTTYWVADSNNFCIRQVAGGIITTIAGICGYPGAASDGMPATLTALGQPWAVAYDVSTGNIFFTVRRSFPDSSLVAVYSNAFCSACNRIQPTTAYAG